MRTTTLEVTFRITAKVSEALDENSIKAVINDSQKTIFQSSKRNLISIDDTKPEMVMVELSKLKQNGKLIDLGSFGTPELPWK